MRSIRRVGGMAIAGILLTGFIGGPAAHAQTQTKTPETYVGSAAGHALRLKIGSTQVSGGVSNVKLDSTLKAAADAAGTLGLPLVGGSNAGLVEVAGNDTKQAKPEVCATPTLPAPISSVANLGVACSSSLAEVSNNLPHALANGTVAKLDVSANTVLAQLPLSALDPIVNGVLGGIDTINNTLSNISGGNIPDLQADDTVGDLLNALKSVKTVSANLGSSTSEVTTEGTRVISTATSKAGLIQILPLGASVTLPDGTVELKPVIEIEVGSSKAQAIYDRATGKSTPSFDPAIVTLRINTPTTDVLSGYTDELAGVNLREIKIAPDTVGSLVPVQGVVNRCSDAANEICILEGTPLETRLTIASGRTVTNPDGTVGAVADAVKVHLLKNFHQVVSTPLDGGILLELAHAEAGVGGKPAELITIAIPEIPRELPRTGGTPWLPIAAIAGVAIALASRRTLAKVTAR